MGISSLHMYSLSKWYSYTPLLNNIGLVLHSHTWHVCHIIIVPRKLSALIVCALHPGLVSIPFLAIPISLLQFIEFLFTSLLGCFQQGCSHYCHTKCISTWLYNLFQCCWFLQNIQPEGSPTAIQYMYATCRSWCIPLMIKALCICIRECTTHICVVLMNNFNSNTWLGEIGLQTKKIE